MRWSAILILITSCLRIAGADDIRGPVVAELSAMPGTATETVAIGVDEIVLAGIGGDSRFHDALEIEITVPAAAVSLPGALSVIVLTSGSLDERAGVYDIAGNTLLSRPLTRAGRMAVIVPLRADAEIAPGATSVIVDELPGSEGLPLAISLQSQMKGAPSTITSVEMDLVVRSIARNIGAVSMVYLFEDGTSFDPDGLLAPEFRLTIDDRDAEVTGEYLLEPGIHRVALQSETYQDQSLSVGIERGLSTSLTVPLLPALATINYTAPRGSLVWLDGRRLNTESGVFTAPPGEHTIVVTVGGYTVTRRFEVAEGREYNLSVTMDVALEETK